VRVPLTRSSDLSVGFFVRSSRRRRGKRGAIRRWTHTAATATCIVVAALAPVATVAGANELTRVAAVAWGEPRAAPLVTREYEPPRPVLYARHAPITAIREDPPALEAHVVGPGETLLSIAAGYGITPQTLAYNNGLADTASLRDGQALVVPPLDAAIYVVREGETIADIATRFGADPGEVRDLNRVAYEPTDVTDGRVLLVPVPDGRFPGFRLRVTDAPRVLAPHVLWPTAGVVTQLFSASHTGVDIAAPYGSPIVASDAGTVTEVGWRGPGGLSVCVLHDWGLETCDYHASAVNVELGERVARGERIASVGSTGTSTGPHVHWEARTNGVLVDPMTYAPTTAVVTKVGGATGQP